MKRANYTSKLNLSFHPQSLDSEGNKKTTGTMKNLQCCQVFPARSSAFFVASPTFLPHLPNTVHTESTVSDQNASKKI